MPNTEINGVKIEFNLSLNFGTKNRQKKGTKLNTALPSDFILFLSGVSGVGKTTIAYNLLSKEYTGFRRVDEMDILRECARYYTSDKDIIKKSTKQLTYEEMKEQCNALKQIILNVAHRQQRNNIPTIIEGVSIIPECLLSGDNFKNKNYLFIHLYCSDIDTHRSYLHKRELKRITSDEKNALNYFSKIRENNDALYQATLKLINDKKMSNVLIVDVAKNNIENIIAAISEILENYISDL